MSSPSASSPRYPRSIAVLVDPRGHRTPAVDRALDLARRSGCRTWLCLIDSVGAVDVAEYVVGRRVSALARSAFLAERQQWLGKLSLRWQQEGLRVDCIAEWGSPFEKALVRCARRSRANLFIADRPEGPAGQRSATRLVRTCPAPVLFVKDGAAPAWIIGGVDRTSEPAQRGEPATEVARSVNELSQAYGVPGRVAHALSYDPASVSPYRDLASVHEKVRRMDRESFERFASVHGFAAAQALWREGDPAEVLNELAGSMHESGIVVVATAGRRGLDRFFMGSTAETLVKSAARDLLVLPAPPAIPRPAPVNREPVRRRIAQAA